MATESKATNEGYEAPDWLCFKDLDTGSEVILRVSDIQSFTTIVGGSLIHCRNKTDYRVTTTSNELVRLMRMRQPQ